MLNLSQWFQKVTFTEAWTHPVTGSGVQSGGIRRTKRKINNKSRLVWFLFKWKTQIFSGMQPCKASFAEHTAIILWYYYAVSDMESLNNRGFWCRKKQFLSSGLKISNIWQAYLNPLMSRVNPISFLFILWILGRYIQNPRSYKCFCVPSWRSVGSGVQSFEKIGIKEYKIIGAFGIWCTNNRKIPFYNRKSTCSVCFHSKWIIKRTFVI